MDQEAHNLNQICSLPYGKNGYKFSKRTSLIIYVGTWNQRRTSYVLHVYSKSMVLKSAKKLILQQKTEKRA